MVADDEPLLVAARWQRTLGMFRSDAAADLPGSRPPREFPPRAGRSAPCRNDALPTHSDAISAAAPSFITACRTFLIADHFGTSQADTDVTQRGQRHRGDRYREERDLPTVGEHLVDGPETRKAAEIPPPSTPTAKPPITSRPDCAPATGRNRSK